MKEKVFKEKNWKRILSVALAIIMVLTLIPMDSQVVYAAGNTAEVTNLEGLQNALANSEVTTVIVKNTITLTNGTVLDGNGKTVQVEKPYIEESGFVNSSPNNYRVFTVKEGATVTIKNMTICGGSGDSRDISREDEKTGGIHLAGILTLENVNILRSYRAISISGSGRLIAKNSNFVRNQAGNAGAIFIRGKAVLDGCSLTENRSTESGGGAIEQSENGIIYANNTVIANNISKELGGAVNNCNSQIYLMNCTIVGNITVHSDGVSRGGAIGANSPYGTKLVNCIMVNNYSIKGGTGTADSSDIGVWDNGYSNVEFIYCVYGSICKHNSGTTGPTMTNCKPTSNDTFNSYRNDGVLCSNGSYSTGYKHPALINKNGNEYALYANSSSTGDAATGGIDTWFEYNSDLSTVNMIYGTSESRSAIVGSVTDTAPKITTTFEGTQKVSGVIGACGTSSDTSTYYTVKLPSSTTTGGRVQGLTNYGDSYKEGDSVTVTAVPDNGYIFTEWKDASTTVSTDKTYTFTISKDMNLSAKFESHMHTWNYSSGTGSDSNKLYAYCTNGTRCDNAGTSTDLTKALSLTLTATSQTYSGSSYTGASIDSTAWTGAGLTAPTIMYVGRGSTTYTSSSTAPTNAGTYTASITVDTKTASVDFEITKAEQTATVSVSNYDYNSTPSSPSSSNVKDSASVTYYYNTTNNNTGGTLWSGLTGTTLNPGTYYVYGELTETDNYNVYITPAVAFTVNGLDFGSGDVTASSYNAVYDGLPHGITVTAPSDATITYGRTSGTYDLTENPTETNATSSPVTIYYKVSKTGYNDKTGSATITISQKEITSDDLTWTDTSLTYNGSEQKPTATVNSSALCGDDTCTVTVSGGQTNAGNSYTATAASLSNSNYKLPSTAPATAYSIAKKTIGINWGESVLEYNGTITQAPTATATGLCGSDTCTITVSGAQKNKGNYTATATGLSNSNYELPATGTTKDFEIKAADMVVDAENTSVTYDGNPHDISIGVTLPNQDSSDSYTIKYGLTEGTYNLTTCPTRTVYGETTVFYQITADNYNTVTGSKKINIGKKSIDGVSVTGVDTTYDGNEYGIDVTKPAEATVTYKTAAEDTYSATAPKFKDAGTYTVYYKIEIDDNYSTITGQKSVVINPLEVGLSWGNTAFTYNGKLQKPSATATGLVAGDTCTVTVTGGEKNAGTTAYTATASELSNANYMLPADVTTSFTIARKQITVTPKNSQKHIEKEDPELEFTVTGLVTGDILTGITLAREVGEEAGTYKITATSDQTKDTNYAITISGKGIFTIEDHKWSEYVDDDNANTETDGTKTATCSVCDKKDVQIIPGTRIEVARESTVEEAAEVGDGKIITEAVVDKSVPKTEIDNLTVDTAKSLLDDESLAAVVAGATVTVFLNVVNIENTISKEDKGKIQNIASTISSEAQVGMFLDLSLFTKLSTDEGAKRVTDTNGKMIDVSIAVPEELVNTDTSVIRSFYIAQIHDGKTRLIDTEYSKDKKVISFGTSKFSTYAIVYKDEAITIDLGNVTTDEIHLKTGESFQIEASVTPSTADQKLSYETGDSTIATVDEKGLITAVAVGTTTITIKNADGSVSKTITVIVEKSTTKEKTAIALNAGLKVTQPGKKIKVEWGQAEGADGYLVYVTYCGSKYGKAIKSTSKTLVSITKIGGEKIDFTKKFKVYVKAYKVVDDRKVILGRSISAHVAGKKNTKFTNIKSVNITSKTKLTLSVGKSSKIKAGVVLEDSNKKQLSDAHANTFRYRSTNEDVASVSTEGKIKAVGKGTCHIYVYAKNGVSKTVKVTVK